jgi:hypothetical protein
MLQEGENGEYLSYAFKTRTQVLQTVQFSAHSLIQGHARSFLEKPRRVFNTEPVLLARIHFFRKRKHKNFLSFHYWGPFLASLFGYRIRIRVH